jgi:hypothetical protein
MATLDEITKEKQQIGEALVRLDAQREKLAGSSVNWRRLSVCSRAMAQARGQERWPRRGRRLPRRRRLLRRGQAGASALQSQGRLAASSPRRALMIKSLPWQPARRSRKLPPRAKGLARTMSAPRLPGTGGLAASRSATGSFTPRSRPEQRNARRSDTTINGTST